ncbi:MAG: hypothetical protein IT556_08045 [Acetobacteraceae bacterium]|nr:hypothetical protein [Acetobacteraceae bacterium]
MGLARRYNENEVSRLLKKSEDVAVAGAGGRGHSEGLHELQAVGAGRKSTTTDDLMERILAEAKAETSAFDGSQVEAVTHALNTAAGLNALTILANRSVSDVMAFIAVGGQNFKMVRASRKAAGPARPGKLDLYLCQWEPALVSHVAMKLMKASADTLHIRTAYPMAAPPKDCTALTSMARYHPAGGMAQKHEI